MYKKLKISSACFLFSVVTIFMLYVASLDNQTKNGFNRDVYPVEISSVKKIDLKYSGYYLAGYTFFHIYLANYQTPLHVVETNYALSDTAFLTLGIPDKTKFHWKSARVSIDSPYAYVNEGRTPALLRTKLNNLKLAPYMENSVHFISALPLSPSSIITKSVQRNPRENILIKQMSQPYRIKKAKVLEKQIDGLFCTDGALNYDKRTSNKVVYLYHYRNEYICMDSSLRVVYKGNTIDTTSKAKIKVGTIASEQKTTLASPPVFVNKNSCIFNNRLFVESALIADNELKHKIRQKTVIDTYSLDDGKYEFSFYIPYQNEEKITDFQIVNNSIIAIYDRHLYVYELDFERLYKFAESKPDRRKNFMVQ